MLGKLDARRRITVWKQKRERPNDSQKSKIATKRWAAREIPNFLL
jgi:hypothetical protein